MRSISTGRILASIVSLMAVAAVSTRVVTQAQIASAPYANFEGAQTNPIRLSPDGTRLFAVNTPAATLSVFDLTQGAIPTRPIAEIPVGVEPVSVYPRTNDEAWVVNQVSDSISVVSVSKKVVTDTIYIKDEPMDVVIDGSNQAYISAGRSNQIVVVDANTHAVKQVIPVAGGNPRALALSPGGKRVYAAFAMSGNATTLLPAQVAPPQSPPTNPLLPPPPHVALIIQAADPQWSKYIPYKMPDNDVVAIDSATLSVTRYYSGVGTVNLGLAVNPTNGDLYVSNTDARNLVHFETNLQGHIVDNRITRIQVATSQITPFVLNPDCAVAPGSFCIDYTQSTLPNAADLRVALAQPTSVAVDPSGNFMYVAAFGTDRIATVDTNGNVLSIVEVGPPSGQGANVDPRRKRGPRGLALNPAGQMLYVLNRISNTISSVNTATKLVAGEIPVGSFDPTPLSIRTGRGFLYDAKLSGTGNAACAACHVDGEADHLAWDLGNPGGDVTSIQQLGQTISFHPMKGPMVTQTLRGLLNLSPYHWRGDKVNFAAFNGAFQSLMGGTQLSSADMTAYTDFVNTILYQPNPNQNLDRSLPATLMGGSPANGLSDYMNLALTAGGTSPQTCNACHTANPGPGTNRLVEDMRTPLKIPQLRAVYQKVLYSKSGNTIDGFGLDHDGHGAGLFDFLNGPAFMNYSQQQKVDLRAYMMAFDTGTAPAVGYTRTLTAASVGSSAAQSDWTLLEAQAAAGNIDLITRGTISGQLAGLLYRPPSKTYAAVSGTVYTRTQVQAFIQGADTMSLMGVYPGTGNAASIR